MANQQAQAREGNAHKGHQHSNIHAQHTYRRAHTNMCANTRTHECAHARTHIPTPTYTYTHLPIHPPKHIHTHTHANPPTHQHAWMKVGEPCSHVPCNFQHTPGGQEPAHATALANVACTLRVCLKATVAKLLQLLGADERVVPGGPQM